MEDNEKIRLKKKILKMNESSGVVIPSSVMETLKLSNDEYVFVTFEKVKPEDKT